MKLSVIVPSLSGSVPKSLREQVAENSEVEIVSIVGVRPVGKARNEGLRRATGEYVAWVDGDDEVAGDWLLEIFAALEKRPDAVIFDAKNEDWPCMGDLVYGKPNADSVVADVYENECLQGHLWRTVTRRALWDDVVFDETVRAMEDFLALPSVLSKAAQVVYLPKRLYRYRRNEGSALASVDLQRDEESIRVAIRRWQEAPTVYKAAALRGSVRLVYDSLLVLNVDPRYCRLAAAKAAGEVGVRFLRSRCWGVRATWRERLRFVCAGFGFWLPQRLVYRKHFGK